MMLKNFWGQLIGFIPYWEF
ncbi:hypothetical protein Nmel_003460 [Mimus melanotis]